MLRWYHEQLAREVLSAPLPALYDHFTFINFEVVGALPVSLLGYSLSCGIPIELIIQISYIRIVCIQIGIIQIMDYRSLTKSLLELAEKSTVWESTIIIQLLTMRILFLTLAWQLGEDGQSPLMEQPSSQLTTLMVPATCLILICMVNIHGKNLRVC
jgi:hypothetical protein